MIEARFRGSLGAFALDAGFAVPARGVTGLFGPSGCGKTTMLRCIAGLQRLPGSCVIAGETWQDETRFLPAHRRPVGYVFQEASLFPHLSVRSNLLFGAPDRAAADFDETIALLGLSGLLDRAPRHLSGGERQRVAIGRALLSRPRLMLMDEPLSALDRPTRDEILPFLERLHEALALPILYVTHDMAEIERLADHLVLMAGGRVVAAGPLAVLQSDPALPLAAARDAAVSLDATVEGYDPADGLLALGIDGSRFLVPGPAAAPGSRRRLRIAAGDVSLALEAPRDSTILNILPSRIASATHLGAHEMLVLLALGPEGTGPGILARITRRSWHRLALAEGMAIHAQIKGAALTR